MIHILLVDDDLNFRRSLVIELELEGYRITEAENATQALSFLEKCQSKGSFPDVVITDVRMPEIGGGEFAILVHAKYPQSPILVISAFDLPEGLSGYPFLRKPFKIDEMIGAINKICSNKNNLTEVER